MSNLIGNAPYQVPTNADLGDLAYQDSDYAIVGNLNIDTTLAVGANATIAGSATIQSNATIGGNTTVTGNVTGGNLNTSGVLSVTGNASITGNVTGGNLNTSGVLSVTGNASVSGNVFLSQAYAPLDSSPNVAVSRGYVDIQSIVWGF
jgi:UDP-3-O-[3-hydroxymyristoyl] glucosamine N-acyltransferase